METKKCSKCGEVKPVSEFYRKGKNYQSMCILCRVEYHKEWYEKNSERRREQIRQYKQMNKNAIFKKREKTKSKEIEEKRIKNEQQKKIKNFKKDLILINESRFVLYCGEKKDLLDLSDIEFIKLEKVFKIKGVFLEEIKIIKEVRNELSN